MKRFPIRYEGKQYDISTFLQKHPGGVNYLQRYREKDITQRMTDHFHSQSAHYLLREYKLDGRDENETTDLERLVDWSKPMLSQVGSLGSRYHEWVTAPVDRHLRLFENRILEQLTITPWFIVPIIWLPIVIYYIHKGCLLHQSITGSTAPLSIILFICVGVVLWSLIEYSLHRWVFHMTPSGDSKMLIYIHFAIHGLHHKVPFDSRRLVFPPVPAALVTYVGHQIYSKIFPESVLYLIAGGSILGYVIYDMTHFYLHNGNPKDGTYLYNMKRYHNHHHFSHHDSGFGISSPSWDQLFGTIIKLRKLATAIRWK